MIFFLYTIIRKYFDKKKIYLNFFSTFYEKNLGEKKCLSQVMGKFVNDTFVILSTKSIIQRAQEKFKSIKLGDEIFESNFSFRGKNIEYNTVITHKFWLKNIYLVSRRFLAEFLPSCTQIKIFLVHSLVSRLL